MDEATKAIAQNCELLRTTLNTLNGIIAQRNKESGLEYCDATTLAAAAKIVYERWEQERRKLPREDLRVGGKLLVRQDLLSADLDFPREIQDKILAEIKQSQWYKMVWGNGPK